MGHFSLIIKSSCVGSAPPRKAPPVGLASDVTDVVP